jgi:hypothetical protein
MAEAVYETSASVHVSDGHGVDCPGQVAKTTFNLKT